MLDVNPSRPPPRHDRGFSVVELVVAIVLVAIVSAVAASRFLGGNSFDGAILRDQIISISRNAQQGALGRPGVTVTVQPDSSGDTVTITASDSNGSITSVTSDLGDLTLSGDINETSSCSAVNGANGINNTNPLTLAFEELGSLGVSGVTGSTGVVNSALRICINNDPLLSVCVAPSGFAYAGDCDV